MQNIKISIKFFIHTQLVDSTKAFIVREISGMTDALLKGDYDVQIITNQITAKLPDFLLGISKNILGFVKPKSISGMLEKTVLDAIKNIELGKVEEQVTNGFIKNGSKIITNNVSRLASNEVNRIISNTFARTPILKSIAAPSVQLNFDNIGEKIKSGRIDQIITLDPTTIAINTRFVSFKGSLR